MAAEQPEKRKIAVIPHLHLDTVKQTAQSTPSSPVLRKFPSVRQNCLCSPTTHAGSFRCRYHRNGLTRSSVSVGSKLSELASTSVTPKLSELAAKPTELCDALHAQ